MGRLDGRVMVVTGGGRGFGRAFSLGLAREGAAVVIAELDEESARQTQAAVEELGGRAMVCQTDVTDEDSVLHLRDTVIDQLGDVDGLINNAGILSRVPMDRTTKADWDRVFDTNVWGGFICARAFADSLARRGGGSIVNMGSSMFLRPAPGHTLYMATKGAVVAITRSLATDLGPRNIRVNALVPAFTATPGGIADIEDLETYTNERVALQLIKRGCEPEDVVGAAIFLLSDESSFITGQCLPVTGGAGMV